MSDLELRKAAQQALEALENERYVSTICVDAITALRAALAQPDEEDADAIIIQHQEGTIKRLEKRIEELQAALAISRSLSAPKFPEWNIKG